MTERQQDIVGWRHVHVSSILLNPSCYWVIGAGFVYLALSFLPQLEAFIPGALDRDTLIEWLPRGCLLFGFLTIVEGVRRHFKVYAVLEDRLMIRTGIVQKKEQSIPFERLHNIDTTQSIPQRLFNTYTVHLQTSSGSEAEAVLDGLKIEVVDELRRALASYEPNETEQVGAQEVVNMTEIDANDGVLHQMTTLECVMLAFIRRSGIAFATTVVVLLLPLRFIDLPDSWELQYVLERLTQDYVIVSDTPGYFPSVQIVLRPDSDWMAVLMFAAVLIVLFVLLMTLVKLAINIALYHGFKLTHEGSEITASAGLLVNSRKKTPLHRVQLVQVISTIRSRLFSRASIRWNTSAAGEMEGSLVAPLASWLVPLLEPNRVPCVLDAIFPNIDLRVAKWEGINTSRAWSRRIKSRLVYVLIATGLMMVFSPWFVLMAMPLTALTAMLSKLYVESVKFAILADAVVFERGPWRRSKTIIPFDKIQGIEINQTLLDRRHGMATLVIDCAARSGGLFGNLASTIPYVNTERARALAETLLQQSASRRFDW